MPAAIGRLTRRPEFLRVARGGCKWAAPGLVLQARRAELGREAAGCRVGFTASRKVGNAVERNRARRRLKAAVAAVMPGHGRAGIDYVVIARRGTLGRPFTSLRQDLQAALDRVHSRSRATARAGRRAGA